MVFHRLTPPGYGSLPPGYDFINTPQANGDPGAPAFVNDKSTTGPNHGTYFVGFGDDATSANVNRGSKALAENTDHLDELLHRSIAVTRRTADTLATSPVSSFAIAGEVFVGALGAPSTQDQRRRLVSILDDSDQEIIDSSGATVEASLIHDGSNNNVVGTQSNGFFRNPTVQLSPAVPAGVRYRVYYGEKTTLAELPADALTSIVIRGADEVDGNVERQLRNLHAPGGAQAWDAPWDSTIRDLALSGLNERYRRAAAGTGTANRAGDGATIIRDGKALTIVAPELDVRAVESAPDPFMAQFAAVVGGETRDSTNPDFGGHIGLCVATSRRNTFDSSERTKRGEHGAAVLSYIERDIRSNSLSNDDGTHFVLTRISPEASATTNPNSASSSADRRTIDLAPNQFFVNAQGFTAVKVGIDMLLVRFESGIERAFVIDEIDIGGLPRRARLRTATGSMPDFGPTAKAVTVTWIQVTTALGGTAHEQKFYDGFVFAPPSKLTEGAAQSQDQCARLFVAPSDDTFADADVDALEWGGVRRRRNTGSGPSVGQVAVRGTLQGDGGVRSNGGRISGFFSHRDRIINIASNGTHNFLWGPTASSGAPNSGSFYISASMVMFLVSSAASDVTIEIDFDAPRERAKGGDELVVGFRNEGAKVAVRWPSDFFFGREQQDNLVSVGSGDITVFRFLYIPTLGYAAFRTVFLNR